MKIINKDNLEFYLRNAKWKYNIGECPNLYENEVILVMYESGNISYNFQDEPTMYNWSLDEKYKGGRILKWSRIKI